MLSRSESPARAAWVFCCAAAVALGAAPPAIANQAAADGPPPVTIHVAPSASDSAAGTATDPVSLLGAQQLVRSQNDDMQSDIEVRLADGIYRLEAPLELSAEDSGTNGFDVHWTAASGATPVLSGADRVTGWTLADAGNGVYAAEVPAGTRTRNLYVDGESATRARTKFTRPSKWEFTSSGLTMTSQMDFLKSLTAQELADVEIRGVNDFTDRYSGVASLNADRTELVMDQPAWKNNTWGWDTLKVPFKEHGFYAENARAFLDEEDEWFLDRHTDTLYYKPADPATMDSLEVELPRLETLLSIGGTVSEQVHHIRFSGVTFTGATWNEPTVTGGYVDQQTGGFLSLGDDYPDGGYPAFEASRPKWNQVPSAVQVSAATDVSIDRSAFVGLGAGGLGIGNDENAHLSGVGLAVQRVSVTGSTFTEVGANAITIGGIQQPAHHPGTLPDGSRDPAVSDETVARMTVSEVRVAGNRIWDVADTYTAGTGILMTYTQDSVIEHNDVVDMPYGAINTGYGWGTNDADGSPEYERRGLYNYQPKFTTPTTAKNNLVHANFIARLGKSHADLGGYYNLSANPGTVVSNNFITNFGDRGLYPDEGSRFLTFNDNVLIHPNWFMPNYGANVTGDHQTGDFSGSGNWTSTGGTAEREDRNVLVEATRFTPADVMSCEITDTIVNAGVPRADRPAVDPDRAHTVCLDASATDTGGKAVVEATFKDLTADHSGVSMSASAPSGWTVEPTSSAAGTVPAGTESTQTWAVTPPSGTPAIATAEVIVDMVWDTGSAQRSLQVVLGAGTVLPPLTTTGNAGYLAGQDGDSLSIRQKGADIWGAGGQSDDDYAAIYEPDAFADGSTMTVKVTEQEAVSQWSKSGLVIRNDLTTPRSAGGYLALLVTPSNGVMLSYDKDDGGLLDTNIKKAGVTAPVTLRLAREGQDVTGSYSTDDGETWTTVGTVTMSSMSDAQDAGVVHVSHDPNQFGVASFSDLRFTHTLNTFTNIGATFAQEDGTHSVTAAGVDTFNGWGTKADDYGAFYVSDALGASGMATVRVDSYDAVRANSKAGLVLRNDVTQPGSSQGYVALTVQQDGGVTRFLDTNGDGYLNTYRKASGSPKNGPVYLRIVRSGASVTTMWSSDGQAWTTVDEVQLTGADERLDVGLTYVSADTSTQGTAVFQEFSVVGGA